MAAPYHYANVLSFDMGRTTAKVGLIQDGWLRLSTEMEVGAQAVTPLGEGRGGGYPVRTPVIDLVEVGAGGGSEAWINTNQFETIDAAVSGCAVIVGANAHQYAAPSVAERMGIGCVTAV